MSHIIALVRREWITNRRDVLIYGTVVSLFLLVGEVLSSIAARYGGMPFSPERYGQSFVPFLLIGGTLLAVMLFGQDLYKKESQHTFLMLPATNVEKFLTKTLLVIVVYPVALVVLFFLSSVVIELGLFLFFANPINFFNPFMGGLGAVLAQFWLVTSFFILGSTLFRKAPFIKTSILAIVLFLTAVALAMLFLRLFATIRFGSGTPSLVWSGQVNRIFFFDPPRAIGRWIVVSKVLLYGLLPLGALVGAYFRLSEVEAIDAV